MHAHNNLIDIRIEVVDDFFVAGVDQQGFEDWTGTYVADNDGDFVDAYFLIRRASDR